MSQQQHHRTRTIAARGIFVFILCATAALFTLQQVMDGEGVAATEWLHSRRRYCNENARGMFIGMMAV
jgi:hypothetical protein